MHSILHRIKLNASPENIFQAISDPKLLSHWWTKATHDTQTEGETLRFYFGPGGEHQIVMQVNSKKSNQELRWTCREGPWKDKGEFIFQIETSTEEAIQTTYLEFAHEGWQETDAFYKHCNGKWAYFLIVSLKQLLERGQGQAHPHDPDM